MFLVTIKILSKHYSYLFLGKVIFQEKNLILSQESNPKPLSFRLTYYIIQVQVSEQAKSLVPLIIIIVISGTTTQVESQPPSEFASRLLYPWLPSTNSGFLASLHPPEQHPSI